MSDLRNKVAAALYEADVGGYYGEEDDAVKFADIALQAVADHIGVTLKQLEFATGLIVSGNGNITIHKTIPLEPNNKY